MRTIKRDIVGAFIFSSDGYLLLGQSISGGVFPDKWLVPAGGIEPGESKLNAVKREVLEETGVDISDAKITPIAHAQTGKSEKILSDTSERVLVKMTFYDFIIELPYPASEVDLIAGDDFAMPQWHATSDIKNLHISPAMQATLTRLGHL